MTDNATAAVPPCSAIKKKSTSPPKLDWKGITTIVLLVIMILLMMSQLMTPLSALFTFSFTACIIGILPINDVFAGMASKGTLALALMFIVVHPLNHLPVVKKGIDLLVGSGATAGGSGMWARTKIIFFSWIISPFTENSSQVALMAPIYCNGLPLDGYHAT
jgi:hypothetical protein